MQNPYRKKRWREFFWITLLGVAISVVLCPRCYTSWENLSNYWRTIVLCLLYTYILGYGSTFIVTFLETKYSWLESPKKKFFLHFVTLFIFSFIISAILFYVYAYLMFDGDKWLTLSEVLNQAKLPAFISISIAAFFTGTDFLTNWKKEAVRAERLEKEKIITQYESLRNQVNPHFLFNSLNALSELVYENQELAVKYIRQLSRVYRYVLDSRNHEVASLHDELDFVESFIFLQQIRFGKNLLVDLKINRSDTKYILPLSLQILLENSIKHNIISDENPLQINLYEEDSYVVIQNKVNKKRTTDKGTGIGLENIKMRYRYLTEKPAMIDETEEEFTVKIPILEEMP